MIGKVFMCAVTGALVLTGCAETQEAAEAPIDKSAFNRALVDVYGQEMARQAIVREMTVYPHHFDAGGTHLNDLGRRDLLAMADHLRSNPGPVHLSVTGTPQRLIEARRVAVREYLAGEGLPMDLIEIDPGLPDGDGNSSRRVLRAIENEDRPLTTSGSSGSRSTGQPTTGSNSR